MHNLGDFVEDPPGGFEDQVKVLHFLGPRRQEFCIRCDAAIYPAEKGRYDASLTLCNGTNYYLAFTSTGKTFNFIKQNRNTGSPKKILWN